MVVVGFIGPMRSGKTLSAVLEAYRHHLQGRRVFSNTPLSFPYEDVDDRLVKEVVKNNRTTLFDGAVILLDEVHVYMDSRASAQKKNRLLSYFVTQSGKLNSLVIWTSQFLGQADKRLRLNTQFLYQAERYVRRRGRKVSLRQDDPRTDFLIDLHKHVFTETARGMGFQYMKTMTIKNPSKWFGLYDTAARVAYNEEEKER